MLFKINCDGKHIGLNAKSFCAASTVEAFLRFQASGCSQTLFEDKGNLLTELAKPLFNFFPLFSCHFSPPFSQSNRDNNYLNLNYDYKGKRVEICSTSKGLSLFNSDTTER